MVTTGRAPRPHRDVEWVRQAAPGRVGLLGWTAIYDRDTEVPLRMWGPGQLASGAMANPATAEAWARKFVAEHIAVLAPGAAAADFVLAANQLSPSGDVRSIGFVQRAGGIAVLGGTISFAFKNDRMIMVGSTALPHVAVAQGFAPTQRLAAARVTSAAAAWLGAAGHRVAPRGAVAAAQVIVPIVHRRGARGVDITYTLAEQVAVETTAGEPGRWNVFIDARTGAAFARESTLMFASGTVQFDVSDRAPLVVAAGRHPQPAANATLKVNGVDVTTGLDGVVTWAGTAPATVGSGLSGPFVAVTNKAGVLFAESLSLMPDATVVFAHPDDSEEAIDAQLDAFIYANQAKQFAKTRLDPTLAYFDQVLSVTVNDAPGQCNAFSTGDDIHFFPRTIDRCENTGRMADVVYHEFGHSMHFHALIPGVGQFNGSMSEGVADTLAVSMIGDPKMGLGFFVNNPEAPLRNLNPAQKKIWPNDADGEVHNEGEIYGQTMWDLRSNLQTSMGTTAGFEQFLKIYYGTVQRAVDIPSCFAEALVADDDDGDLANGTPHSCDIITAFAAHGLYDPTVTGNAARPVRDGFMISVATTAPAGACQIPTVQSAVVAWRLRGGSDSQLPLAASGGTFSATIPTQPDGSLVEYNVILTLSNGSTQVFPNNKADPYYQFYVGPATKLWCADFENGAADWTHSAMPAERDRWEAGAAMGLGGDPMAALAGTGVFGTALAQVGTYPPDTTMIAVSPEIDVQGNKKIHLQYYRWLGVEDGFYDQATIAANGLPVWRNFASLAEPGAKGVNHIDQEWRFQDIDVSSVAASGKIQLSFALTSDPGFEAAGWNLDEVCLVSQDEAEGGCCGVGTNPTAPAGLAALVLGLIWRRRRRSPPLAGAQRLPSLR